MKPQDVNVRRRPFGIECYVQNRDGYHVSRFFITRTEREARRIFAEYVTRQEQRAEELDR